MFGRRRFLGLPAGLALAALASRPAVAWLMVAAVPQSQRRPSRSAHVSRSVTLFLCGDVMTGRGIDQILPHPSKPDLHESYVHDARGYVKLGEHASGDIPRGVKPAYVWGDALVELERRRPAVR